VRQKILVVDDSEVAREWTRYVLEDAQFDVRSAASIAEAEGVLAQWMPDLVLVDVTLPEGSGASLCSELKARLTHLVPVILFSGRTEDELAQLADECGADGFLSKQAGAVALARKVHEIRSAILW
jgi:DNA-binding response OmpR family regulator